MLPPLALVWLLLGAPLLPGRRHSHNNRMSTTSPLADPQEAVVELEDELHLISLMSQIMTSGQVKTRRYRLVFYKNVLDASILVTWLVDNSICSSHAEAVEVGERLRDACFIHHVTWAHRFRDERLYFRPQQLDPDAGVGKLPHSLRQFVELVQKVSVGQAVNPGHFHLRAGAVWVRGTHRLLPNHVLVVCKKVRAAYLFRWMEDGGEPANPVFMHGNVPTVPSVVSPDHVRPAGLQFRCSFDLRGAKYHLSNSRWVYTDLPESTMTQVSAVRDAMALVLSEDGGDDSENSADGSFGTSSSGRGTPQAFFPLRQGSSELSSRASIASSSSNSSSSIMIGKEGIRLFHLHLRTGTQTAAETITLSFLSEAHRQMWIRCLSKVDVEFAPPSADGIGSRAKGKNKDKDKDKGRGGNEDSDDSSVSKSKSNAGGDNDALLPIEIVLESPTLREVFSEFLRECLADESLRFLSAVEAFRKIGSGREAERHRVALRICDTFVREGAHSMINIDAITRHIVLELAEYNAKRSLFQTAAANVTKLMSEDVYRRFLHGQSGIELMERRSDREYARELITRRRARPLGFSCVASFDSYNELDELAHLITQAGLVQDRSYRLKTYKKCFLGESLCEYFVQAEIVTDWCSALALGHRLWDAGIIAHVVDEHPFSDLRLFYRFTSDAFCGKDDETASLRPDLLRTPSNSILADEDVLTPLADDDGHDLDLDDPFPGEPDPVDFSGYVGSDCDVSAPELRRENPDDVFVADAHVRGIMYCRYFVVLHVVQTRMYLFRGPHDASPAFVYQIATDFRAQFGFPAEPEEGPVFMTVPVQRIHRFSRSTLDKTVEDLVIRVERDRDTHAWTNALERMGMEVESTFQASKVLSPTSWS